MGALTHSLKMGEKTWHSRMYHLWLRLGGKKPEYKENLCRYVWIVVLRGPLRWFFKGRVKRVVPPWSVALAACFLAFIAVAFWLWTTVSLKVLMAIGTLVGFVAIIIAVAFICDRNPKRSKQIAKWGTLPIWVVPYGLYKFALWVWKHIEEPFGVAAGMFIYGIRWPWLNPLGLSVMGGIAAFGYFDTKDFLKVLAGLGILAGVVIVGVAVLFGGYETKEYWKKRKETWLDRFADGVVDTVKLGATYVSTKKRGSWICPFIEFEEKSA